MSASSNTVLEEKTDKERGKIESWKRILNNLIDTSYEIASKILSGKVIIIQAGGGIPYEVRKTRSHYYL